MSILPQNNDDCPEAHNGCTCICHSHPGVMHIMPCCSPPKLKGTWRVAEFWSSANPGSKVRMLAEGRGEIAQWEKRDDFIRWLSEPTEFDL